MLKFVQFLPNETIKTLKRKRKETKKFFFSLEKKKYKRKRIFPFLFFSSVLQLHFSIFFPFNLTINPHGTNMYWLVHYLV